MNLFTSARGTRVCVPIRTRGKCLARSKFQTIDGLHPRTAAASGTVKRPTPSGGTSTTPRAGVRLRVPLRAVLAAIRATPSHSRTMTETRVPTPTPATRPTNGTAAYSTQISTPTRAATQEASGIRRPFRELSAARFANVSRMAFCPRPPYGRFRRWAVPESNRRPLARHPTRPVWVYLRKRGLPAETCTAVYPCVVPYRHRSRNRFANENIWR